MGKKAIDAFFKNKKIWIKIRPTLVLTQAKEYVVKLSLAHLPNFCPKKIPKLSLRAHVDLSVFGTNKRSV